MYIYIYVYIYIYIYIFICIYRVCVEICNSRSVQRFLQNYVIFNLGCDWAVARGEQDIIEGGGGRKGGGGADHKRETTLQT